MNVAEPIFVSKSMLRLRSTCQQIAASNVPVLISGETGSGKEVVADLIHNLSVRKNQRCVKVNCAAISKDLFESEMFGHKKGAFTGALEDRKGLFVEADGGTIVLDELSECASHEQAKLLRTLQDHTIRPVGANDTKTVNVRVIAITNQSVESSVVSGQLREDLFFRVSSIHLKVPPLRQRKDDIIPLAISFLEHYRCLEKREELSLSDIARTSLESYHWPGNVRELQNAIWRAVLLSEGDTITAFHLPSSVVKSNQTDMSVLETTEKDMLMDTLRQNGGNKLAAATRLGMGRQTVYNKLKQYGIPINFGKNGHDKQLETTQ